MFLPKPASVQLLNAFNCWHYIYRNVTDDEGHRFIGNERRQWAQAHITSWHCHVPHYLEASGLMEWGSSLRKPEALGDWIPGGRAGTYGWHMAMDTV